MNGHCPAVPNASELRETEPGLWPALTYFFMFGHFEQREKFDLQQQVTLTPYQFGGKDLFTVAKIPHYTRDDTLNRISRFASL